MNIDEAMAIAAKQVGTEQWYYETIEALEVLRVEVERLRAEVQRLDMAGTHSCHDDCQRLPCAQRREIERLRSELAAAKAASECPVELVALGDAEKDWWHCDVNVKCKSGEDADRLYNWLRDRMKERGEE